MKHIPDRLLTALFVLLIFGFGITFWILPDRTFSPSENRVLTACPSVTAKGIANGSLSSDLTAYYSDQFPGRAAWVSLSSLCDIAAGRGEAGGVLLGPDGRLAVRRFDMYVNRTARACDTDYYRPDHVAAGLDALIRLRNALADDGISLTVLLAPRTVDVVAAEWGYPTALSDRLDETIRTTLSAAEMDSVELLATFRALHNSGESVYYRTDHHWTTHGAYTAYTSIMESLGMADEILPASDFSVRSVPDFVGTTQARAGLPFILSDTLEIWERPDDGHFAVCDANGIPVTDGGFISEKYLSQKDKYSAFLGGTHPLITVTDTTCSPGERSRLLVARDSFASPLIPFLARHFDIVAVNLSGGMSNITELAHTRGCDRVLVVCNRENLVTSDCLVRVH